MATYGTEYLKSKNRKQVLDLFLQRQILSRAEIVQNTDMSFPTVSKAVDFLLSRGIVREADDAEKSAGTGAGLGRKRQMLRFNSTAYCAMSLNFEGQYLDMGLVDLSGRLLCRKTVPFDTFSNRAANQKLAVQMRRLLQRAPCPVLGVGIGLPASVDSDTGDVLAFRNGGIDAPINVRALFAGMAEQIALPLFAENDVNLACRGESVRRGAAETPGNLCYLTLGTGFGAGILLDGKLWKGAANRAGEIGGMLVKPSGGAPCPIEDVIGLQALDRRFGLQLLEHPSLTPVQKEQIIDFLLEPMALSLCNVFYLLDLDRFILAGYLPELLGQPLLDRLQETVDRMLQNERHAVSLSAPGTDYNALIGGADLVFENTILSELAD